MATFTDSVIKTRIISAINEFFALDNWDFGDSFYFTELAAYVHNQLAPDLLTLLIVPNQTEINRNIRARSAKLRIAERV